MSPFEIHILKSRVTYSYFQLHLAIASTLGRGLGAGTRGPLPMRGGDHEYRGAKSSVARSGVVSNICMHYEII
jgi:hypothetical protein